MSKVVSVDEMLFRPCLSYEPFPVCFAVMAVKLESFCDLERVPCFCLSSACFFLGFFFFFFFFERFVILPTRKKRGFLPSIL